MIFHAVRMPATEPFNDVYQVHVAAGTFMRKGQPVATLTRPDGVREVVRADAAGRVVSVAVGPLHMLVPDDELLVLDSVALAERTAQQDSALAREAIHPETRIMEESARQAVWEAARAGGTRRPPRVVGHTGAR